MCRVGLVELCTLGLDWELLGMLGSGVQEVLVIGAKLENHSVDNILFVRAEIFSQCAEINWYV